MNIQQGHFIQDSTIDTLRHRLAHHPLYTALTDLDSIRTFMEHHVFAVWDFMSIVKSLQRDLTGIAVPWLPPKDMEAARLINEIVLGEESDEKPDGSFASHFQLYLDAMKEAGAKTKTIECFIDAVASHHSVTTTLEQVQIPKPAQNFVTETFKILHDTGVHIRAAALFYGREDLIPDMFKSIVEELDRSGQPCGIFVYYLNRHIEVDSGDHSIWAERLLARLCDNDQDRKEEARQAAIQVLQSRLVFWDEILKAVLI